MRFNKVAQVGQRNPMDCLEHKCADFEDNPLFDWQPEKLFEDRCNVCEFPGEGDQSVSSVL